MNAFERDQGEPEVERSYKRYNAAISLPYGMRLVQRPTQCRNILTIAPLVVTQTARRDENGNAGEFGGMPFIRKV